MSTISCLYCHLQTSVSIESFNDSIPSFIFLLLANYFMTPRVRKSTLPSTGQNSFYFIGGVDQFTAQKFLIDNQCELKSP